MIPLHPCIHSYILFPLSLQQKSTLSTIHHSLLYHRPIFPFLSFFSTKRESCSLPQLFNTVTLPFELNYKRIVHFQCTTISTIASPLGPTILGAPSLIVASKSESNSAHRLRWNRLQRGDRPNPPVQYMT